MKMYIIVNNSRKMSKGYVAGQVAHVVSLFLYHGYIKKDWNLTEELPSIEKLNEYFDTRITKIILQAPEEVLETLKENDYLVIDDYNKQLNKRFLTACFVGLYDDEHIPGWLKTHKLL